MPPNPAIRNLSKTYSVTFNTALANSLRIKPSAGLVRSISGRIDATAGTGSLYLQLWNSKTVPTDGTTVTTENNLMAPLKIVHTTGTDDRFSLDFSSDGIAFDVGLTLIVSTTEFTLTAATAVMTATAEYK